MTFKYDYGLVTKRRYLWPLINLTVILASIIRDKAQAKDQATINRCHATHCAHH